jgi:hypothetical protein
VIGHRVSERLIPKPMRKGHGSSLERFLATGIEKIIGRRVEVTAMRADQSIFAAEMEVIPVKPESTAGRATKFSNPSIFRGPRLKSRSSIMNI